MGFKQTTEIETVYNELIKIEIVQQELIDSLGIGQAEMVIQKLNNGLSSKDILVDFEDIIIEFVENNASVHVSLTGIGSFGEFPIDIYHFGPLYWVSAQEFDSIKYFNSAEDAIACAEFEYDSFLNEDSEEV
jgi:hypothetical protein